jgi:hypothetical protein
MRPEQRRHLVDRCFSLEHNTGAILMRRMTGC